MSESFDASEVNVRELLELARDLHRFTGVECNKEIVALSGLNARNKQRILLEIRFWDAAGEGISAPIYWYK